MESTDFHDIVWGGRERDCPRCQCRFRSRYNKGCCTNCHLIFNASEIHGNLTDADVAAAVALGQQRIAQRDAEWLAEITNEMVSVADLPPPEPEGRNPIWRQRWFAERQELGQAVADGGSLYVYSSRGPRSVIVCYLVIKEGRITARMTTEEARW